MAKAEDTPKRGPGRPRKHPFPWNQPLGVSPRVLEVAVAVLRTPRGKPSADDEDESSPTLEPPAES